MENILPRGLTSIAAVIAVTLVLTSGAVTALQGPPQSSIPQEFGAAGTPYVDPARCGALPAIIARMKLGMPQQQDWIDSTERQLRDAQAGRLASKAERQDVFLRAAVSFSTKAVGQIALLRKSLEALHNLSPAQASTRLTLLLRLDSLITVSDALMLAGSSWTAGANYRELIQKQMADTRQLLILLNDSGMTDQLASWGANFAMPVVGPLLVETATVFRDYAFADLQLSFSEAELQQHRINLQEMLNAKRRQELQIRDLEAESAACEADKRRGEPRAEEPTPPSTPPPQPERRKGPSGGQTAVIGLGVAAAAGGAGYLAYKYAMEGMELEGDSDTGSPGGGMTLVSGSFNCRYNSGGVVSSCADSVVTVNITIPMAVGSRLKLFTNHIQSGIVATTRNPPGNVTFSGFGGGGWFDTCGPPVTMLGLMNTSVSSSTFISQVTGLSMTVTCR